MQNKNFPEKYPFKGKYGKNCVTCQEEFLKILKNICQETQQRFKIRMSQYFL